MGLGALIEAIDELAVDDPRTLADEDAIVELHRQLARLEAVLTRSVGAYDASGEWQRDGARTPAAAIASACHVPIAAAKRQCRLGRALRVLPVAEQAWLAGNLTGDHVHVLAAVHTSKTAALLARDEALLVGNAKSLSFKHFAKTVAYWRLRADPAGAEAGSRKQIEDRSVHHAQSFGGMWFGRTTLDPVHGAIFDKELRRLEQAMFDADWADAQERLGRTPTVLDLQRTPAQRRADALVEMATRSATGPADGRRPGPLFTVLVGWETLSGMVCELANGTVLTPGTLAPWLDQAWLERVVFESPSRVIDVGAARRLFTGATRRALEVRDRECFHRTCEIDAEDCQGDHIDPWTAGGPTVMANGRLACGHHNRARNQRPPP
jgi:hypothetical protein